MDTNDDAVPSTARLNFGQKAGAAPVENAQAEAQAEAAQQEAMTAEAEEYPEAVVEAEAQTETSDAYPVDAPVAPVIADDGDRLVDEINEVQAHQAAHLSTENDSPIAGGIEAEPVTEIAEPANTLETVQHRDAAVAEQVAGGDYLPSAAPMDEAEAINETMDELAPSGSVGEVAEHPVEKASFTDADETVEIAPAAVTTDGKSVEELQAERQKLDDEIKAKQDQQKAEVLAQIKTVAETYGITPDDIVEAMGGLKSKRKGVKAKPKFRDPATGVIWSGRGKAPAWIKGKNFDDFLIKDGETV